MKWDNLSPDEAASRILSLYDTIPAMDGRLFAAGLTELLSSYPQSVIDLAASPGRGLAVFVDFPSLAKFRKKLEEWNDDYLDLARKERAANLRLLPPPPEDPEMKARVGKLLAGLARQLGAASHTGK